MICVFFVPGMFGSTLEYILRNYSNEYDSIDAEVLTDGSMHSYRKEFHLLNRSAIDTLLTSVTIEAIITPIYPFRDAHLPEILEKVKYRTGDNNKEILIYAPDVRAAELNLLFQYHKISTGVLQLGLDVFCSSNTHNIVNWNPSYQHWSDMQAWELREWFSLFYVQWVQEWIVSPGQTDESFYKVANTTVLENLLQIAREILSNCNLTESSGLDQFVIAWRQKQQYIVDEFNLLDCIVDSTINNIPFEWQTTNFVAESIVQQRLRAAGYEIRCDGLNIFPTDSETLYNLLEKV